MVLISSLSPFQKGSLLSCHPHRVLAQEAKAGLGNPDLAEGEAALAKVWVRWGGPYMAEATISSQLLPFLFKRKTKPRELTGSKGGKVSRENEPWTSGSHEFQSPGHLTHHTAKAQGLGSNARRANPDTYQTQGQGWCPPHQRPPLFSPRVKPDDSKMGTRFGKGEDG